VIRVCQCSLSSIELTGEYVRVGGSAATNQSCRFSSAGAAARGKMSAGTRSRERPPATNALSPRYGVKTTPNWCLPTVSRAVNEVVAVNDLWLLFTNYQRMYFCRLQCKHATKPTISSTISAYHACVLCTQLSTVERSTLNFLLYNVRFHQITVKCNCNYTENSLRGVFITSEREPTPLLVTFYIRKKNSITHFCTEKLMPISFQVQFSIV